MRLPIIIPVKYQSMKELRASLLVVEDELNNGITDSLLDRYNAIKYYMSLEPIEDHVVTEEETQLCLDALFAISKKLLDKKTSIRKIRIEFFKYEFTILLRSVHYE